MTSLTEPELLQGATAHPSRHEGNEVSERSRGGYLSGPDAILRYLGNEFCRSLWQLCPDQWIRVGGRQRGRRLLAPEQGLRDQSRIVGWWAENGRSGQCDGRSVS